MQEVISGVGGIKHDGGAEVHGGWATNHSDRWLGALNGDSSKRGE